MFRRSSTILAAFLLSVFLGAPLAKGDLQQPGPVKSLVTRAGQLGLTVTNLGYVGNFFEDCTQPSGRYPIHSKTEHLYSGGLWVGAITGDGSIRVTTGAQDAGTLDAGDQVREFNNSGAAADTVKIWSNSQNSDRYNIAALATEHIEVVFNDWDNIQSASHVPLRLRVVMRALAYDNPYADDFVILDYNIKNISDNELRDVYVGFWNDTSVGSFDLTDPCDDNAATGWNWYDDKNGAWGPPEWVEEQHSVADDPGIWMMYEHDDDGEEGLAESWIGCRLLGTTPAIAGLDTVPPVSYNSWYFRHVPEEDDTYYDVAEQDTVPGKYQLMGNGAFTVGQIGDDDYSVASDWMGLLATGPFPFLAPGDSLQVTFALVCGADSLALLNHSKVAQVAYDAGFNLPSGPPSPILNFNYDNNSVIMSWAPGDSLHPETGEVLPADDPLRSPEYHISTSTGRLDFQGYRVYRYQGLTISDDPYAVSTLVAQFDKVDGIGFDTGLPPLNDQGLREFIDTDLLDGFPYWYSVVSFSAVDVVAGLPEFQSGFNQNAHLVFPGPAPAGADDTDSIGVYPNPYRAGSMFDGRLPNTRELDRKLWFTGLPARSTIKIFTIAGDLVRTIEHNDPASGQHPWDLLSDYGRSIATGLYIYVVENLDTGNIQRGKLVIIK